MFDQTYVPQPPPIRVVMSERELHRTVNGRTTIYPLVESVTLMVAGKLQTLNACHGVPAKTPPALRDWDFTGMHESGSKEGGLVSLCPAGRASVR